MYRTAGWLGGMRILGVILLAAWAATAVAAGLTYHPGGPLDVLVAAAWWLPVLAAGVSVIRPPSAADRRGEVALAWLGITALLLALPLLLGMLRTALEDGPRILVPSLESAYAAILALGSLALYVLLGLRGPGSGPAAHGRTAALRVVGVALVVGAGMGALLVALLALNGRAALEAHQVASRYGPSGPGMPIPGCDVAPALGATAGVAVRARGVLDGVAHRRAWLDGVRDGLDESWQGGWGGPEDGHGITVAYVRRGPKALLAGATGTAWATVTPDPFDLRGEDGLTLDGPVRAVLAGGPGIVSHPITEDHGLTVLDGAPARLCAMHVAGPLALDALLPLRWLLDGEADGVAGRLAAWRGELRWWVFGDGQLGRAEVAVSGLAHEAWSRSGRLGVLEAELTAVDRGMPVELPDPSPGARY